ncbi:ccch-type zn-finger protein [Stylonychia lemnae]|uniref:Ccch-type zn-finger protein n=1 Tax=Stylonychia lemnae TaxID=5949 RepID=A0A078A1N7_STYLE|nr:ccch-type zn-finger protein [Stylonychia lemnae]|eukprot:CDW75373.1 ccch-type zn-finger protein [Stylonychia lemnae]
MLGTNNITQSKAQHALITQNSGHSLQSHNQTYQFQVQQQQSQQQLLNNGQSVWSAMKQDLFIQNWSMNNVCNNQHDLNTATQNYRQQQQYQEQSKQLNVQQSHVQRKSFFQQRQEPQGFSNKQVGSCASATTQLIHTNLIPAYNSNLNYYTSQILSPLDNYSHQNIPSYLDSKKGDQRHQHHQSNNFSNQNRKNSGINNRQQSSHKPTGTLLKENTQNQWSQSKLITEVPVNKSQQQNHNPWVNNSMTYQVASRPKNQNQQSQSHQIQEQNKETLSDIPKSQLIEEKQQQTIIQQQSTIISQQQPTATTASSMMRKKYEMCKNFKEKGVCKYGEKCLFAHGEHELSRRETEVKKVEVVEKENMTVEAVEELPIKISTPAKQSNTVTITQDSAKKPVQLMSPTQVLISSISTTKIQKAPSQQSVFPEFLCQLLGIQETKEGKGIQRNRKRLPIFEDITKSNSAKKTQNFQQHTTESTEGDDDGQMDYSESWRLMCLDEESQCTFSCKKSPLNYQKDEIQINNGIFVSCFSNQSNKNDDMIENIFSQEQNCNEFSLFSNDFYLGTFGDIIDKSFCHQLVDIQLPQTSSNIIELNQESQGNVPRDIWAQVDQINFLNDFDLQPALLLQ